MRAENPRVILRTPKLEKPAQSKIVKTKNQIGPEQIGMELAFWVVILGTYWLHL